MLKSSNSVITASVGGAFEWYNFIIAAFFAQILGEQFFPKRDAVAQSMLVFAIFAIGHLARPIGGLIFGHIGDKYGRKRSLFYSLLLGGSATIWLVITPNYDMIGVAASILFLIARLLQGIATGGNTIGNVVYATEMTSKVSRGFWVGIVYLSVNRGVLLATGMSAMVFAYLNNTQIETWGWRVAFLFGLLIMFLAIYLNRNIPETPYHQNLSTQDKIHHAPIKLLFSQHKYAMFHGIGITFTNSVLVSLLLLYLPAFLHSSGFSEKDIVKLNLVMALVFSSALPIFGYIGDRIGLKKLLIFSTIALILHVNFSFSMITNNNGFSKYYGIILLALNFAATVASAMTILVSIFPTNVRNSGVGFSYNLCSSVVTGVVPLTIISLGNHIMSLSNAASLVVIIGASITLLSCLIFKTKQDHLICKNPE